MYAFFARVLRYVFIGLIYYFLYNFLKIMVMEISLESQPRDIGYYLLEEDGATHPLYKITTVGRAGDSDIVIEDPYLSSKHALIIKKRRQLVLQDLNSTNGSFLNGKRIKKAVALKEKDEIMLGHRKFTLLRRESVGIKNREGLR